MGRCESVRSIAFKARTCVCSADIYFCFKLKRRLGEEEEEEEEEVLRGQWLLNGELINDII